MFWNPYNKILHTLKAQINSASNSPKTKKKEKSNRKFLVFNLKKKAYKSNITNQKKKKKRSKPNLREKFSPLPLSLFALQIQRKKVVILPTNNLPPFNLDLPPHRQHLNYPWFVTIAAWSGIFISLSLFPSFYHYESVFKVFW